MAQDPGRPRLPRQYRQVGCCPRSQHSEGVVTNHDIGAYPAASSSAVYASRMTLPPSMQDSLPAGELRLCRTGVEPAGSLRTVSVRLSPPFVFIPRSGACLTQAGRIGDATFTISGPRTNPRSHARHSIGSGRFMTSSETLRANLQISVLLTRRCTALLTKRINASYFRLRDAGLPRVMLRNSTTDLVRGV